jgi:hypothetical protein
MSDQHFVHYRQTIWEDDFKNNLKTHWRKNLTKCKSVWLSSRSQYDTSIYEWRIMSPKISTIICWQLLCSWISRKPSTQHGTLACLSNFRQVSLI